MAARTSPRKLDRRTIFFSGAELDLPAKIAQETIISPDQLWAEVQQALASKKGNKKEVNRKFREFRSTKKFSGKILKGLVRT